MKILSLDLKAFGPFTREKLDFSGGSEGLHIVYGPNEAGKSAALRALKALLFGVPERTADDFVHEAQKLRLGGTVRGSDGVPLTFQRRKGRARTLLDENEAQIDEAVLRSLLGGMSEDLFSRMFGISHEDLVLGGHEIVAGRGDVGEALFSAGLGVAGLHEYLEELEREADDLFRPRASSKIINAKTAEYEKARKLVKELSLPPREWDTHTASLRGAEAERERIGGELRRLRREANRLERIHKALPLISARKDKLAKRRGMGDVLILRESFSEERRESLRELGIARVREQSSEKRIAVLKQEVEGLEIPEAVLTCEGAIMELYRRLGSHTKAMKDIVGLQAEKDRLVEDACTLLRDLKPGAGLEAAESFRLGASRREQIRSLIVTHQTLKDRQSGETTRIASLNKRIADISEQLGNLGKPPDVGMVREVVRAAQGQGDLEKELAEARAQCRSSERQAQAGLSRLPLWSGTLDELEGLQVPPPETIERFEQDSMRIDKETFEIDTLLKDTEKTAHKLASDVRMLDLAGVVPTEEDLKAARERRSYGWSLVRSAWLEGHKDEGELAAFGSGLPLDKAYEESVEHADSVSDRLRREAERVAKKTTWLAELERHRKDLDTYRSAKEKILEGERALKEQWEALWGPLGIRPLPPREMRTWVLNQQRLLQTAETLRTLHQRVGVLQEMLESHERVIRGCLSPLLEGESLDGLGFRAMVARGVSFLDDVDAWQKRRHLLDKSLSDLEQQLSDITAEASESDKQMLEWKEKWERAVVGLTDQGPVDPSVVGRLLERSQELLDKLDKAKGLQKRVDGITKDAEEFVSDVRELTARIGSDISGLPAEHAVTSLHARLAKAKTGATRRDEIRKQINEKEDELGTVREAIQSCEARLAALLEEAGCTTYEEMEDAERVSDEARSLNCAIEQLSGQLASHAGGLSIEDFVREAQGVDADRLPDVISEHMKEITALEERLSVIDQTIGSERKELERMDGSARAAEAAETAQAALAGIRQAAERYVRLRMASAVLRSEIERNRAASQGPVLTRAGHLFSVLTGNSFKNLKTDYDAADKPVLVGIRPNGLEVAVEGMSEGTCDQLYLALRVASLERHMLQNEPMPFIVDDILINFDDLRAEAALRVLAELSLKTQVIFFTHHQHLVELAKDAVSADVLYVHSIRGNG